MKLKLITLGLALGLANFAHGASYAPVPLTASSFQFDNVIESNWPPIAYYAVNCTIDNGTGSPPGGSTMVEAGAESDGTVDATYGIPRSGTNFTSQAAGQSGHHFQMPNFKTRTNNNVLGFGPVSGKGSIVQSGSLAINDPTDYIGLSFVLCAGNGPNVCNVTVQHLDGNNEVFNNQTTTDWFNGTAPGPNIGTTAGVTTTNYWVWVPKIRAGVGGNGTGALPAWDTGNRGSTTAQKLYSWDILLADTTSPVTNVTFTYVSGGVTMVLCVSGSTDGVSYNPVASVSGFNYRGVIPAAFPLPYNATMDNGTNLAAGNHTGENTWYEQGWYPNAPTTGFPFHGTTITSAATGRAYQMPPDYTVAMCALVDTNHQIVNLTPATPLSYTAFSLLVAGGNVGNSGGGAAVQTNILVMQHQDGSSETNLFYGYDWFNNSQPVAYNTQGRANFDGGMHIDTFNTGNPKLFESQFVLQNSRSPVTNMLILYYNPARTLNVASTTFIFAVSATAGGIPLIFNTNTLAQNVYSGGTASFVANVTAGTDRNSIAHYQWQSSLTEYGTYSNLTDGVGGVAGSTTSNLTIAAVAGGSVGYYQCIITNTVSTNTSSPAPLTLLVSTASNISQPGDSISSFGGTTSGAGAPGAVDGTLAEYVNAGAGVGAFVGPVGYVTTPAAGNSIITAMRFFTASTSPASDPADYLLEGSPDGVNFTAISSGSLALSDVRNENLTDPIDVTDQVLQEVDFANTAGYNTYRVTFNNVKTNASATSLQVSEVQLLGSLSPLPPGILVQPSGSQKLFVGETFVATVKVNGPSPYTYYWYNGPTLLPSQTSASLTLNNVQLTDSGTYSCTISNIYGSTNSATVTLSVIARPPGYASTILTDSPIAYWRLDEPDNGGPTANTGTIANDYVGSHDGIYTNVSLGLPGYSVFDSDTAAGFALNSINASYVGAISGINFTNSPASNNATFSVEAWTSSTSVQTGGAGIVALGFGGGGEQFALDCGGTSNGFRFYFRDAATGAAHNAVSSISASDGKWHHLVGVVDEVNSNASLYVDGLLAGITVVGTNQGVQGVTTPFTIGSRSSGAGTGFDLQFSGDIDEVAIYSNALSAAQVQNHYFSAGIIPTLTVSPTNTTASEGTTATFRSLAYGSPSLAYQWWNSDSLNPTTPLIGQTGTNLTFINVSAALDQTYYQIVVSNSYGAVTSAPALLTVATNAPQVLPGGDLNANYVIYAGNPLVLPVSAGGSQPITYGWSFNGSPLANGGRVSGANTNVLIIANAQTVDSGTYQLFMTNNRGTGQSMLATVTVLPVLTLNGLGTGWSQNGASGLFNGSNSVQLTDGGGSEARSVFYGNRVYVSGFIASFTYQSTGGPGGADGATFCIQNDPRGTAAVGPAGGGLGYGANSQNFGTSIAPSVALEFNIYAGNNLGGVGIALDTDGLVGPVIFPGVGIDSGDPINVTVAYLNGTATLTLTDAVASTTFTTSVPIDIPGTIGTNQAFVGFTGATGGVTSTQIITNFSFVSIIPLSVSASGGNVTFSWPAEVGGYQLQSNPAINNAAGWTTLTNIPSIIGNQNQIVLPASIGAGNYFRLVNP
jgi:hypothetical protein